MEGEVVEEDGSFTSIPGTRPAAQEGSQLNQRPGPLAVALLRRELPANHKCY